MAELQVINWKRKALRKMEVPDSVFVYPMKEHLLWETIRHYQAVGRRGTHSTKTRAEVKGSGRKPWKQKRTGRARIGSIRSPLWRTGGIVHGPRPRNHSWRLPGAIRRNALKSALSRKLKDGELLVLVDLQIDTHKTRELRARTETLLAEGGSTLWVDKDTNRNLEMAARNVSDYRVVRARGLNVVDILRYRNVVMSEAAVKLVSEDLQK